MTRGPSSLAIYLLQALFQVGTWNFWPFVSVVFTCSTAAQHYDTIRGFMATDLQIHHHRPSSNSQPCAAAHCAAAHWCAMNSPEVGIWWRIIFSKVIGGCVSPLAAQCAFSIKIKKHDAVPWWLEVFQCVPQDEKRLKSLLCRVGSEFYRTPIQV